MLTIRNIKQIELTFCHRRGLREVTELRDMLGKYYYSFHFGPIGDGKDFFRETEVRLSRNVERDGSYTIFVMGLQAATENNILPSDIKTKDGLAREITKVLTKAEYWWQNSNLQNKTK